jgi:hypothetical protein
MMIALHIGIAMYATDIHLHNGYGGFLYVQSADSVSAGH